MESKKINQLATELTPALDDLTIIGDPTTGISKKITLSQMASLFTGTVEEYANLAAFPLVGVADTIYIALDTNVLYRWNTGTNAYVELSPNIINSLVFSDANGFDGNISLVGSTATLTITTALTTGSVPFIGASGALSQDNANLFFDNTNNRLGIGTNAPTTALDVFGSGIIGRINGTSTNNAFLGFASTGTNRWSIGNVQADHRFRIYNEATTSELISLLSTGEFGIGIANPTTKVHIDGGASALIANLDANISVAKSVSFRSDNSNRFNIEVSGTESGSNAGADFFIRRYSDAGSLIDTPLTITRSTGAISLATALSATSATFSAAVVFSSTTSHTGTAGFGIGSPTAIDGSDGRIITNKFRLYNTTPATIYSDFVTAATSNRSITVPDISGTLALLEGTQTFSGAKTFSSAATFSSSVTTSDLIQTNKTGGLVYRAYFGSGNNRPLDINIDASNGDTHLTWNTTYNGGWKYFLNNYAAKIASGDGLYFSVAASGTAGNTISWVNAMSITSGGNVGIGVVPNSWFTGGGYKVLELGVGLSLDSGNDFRARIASNAFVNSVGDWTYRNTSQASNYTQFQGNHIWETASSGTAGSTITFTERMRLTSSGQLQLVGSAGTLRIGTNGSDYGLLIYSGGVVYLQNAWASTSAYVSIVANGVGMNVFGTGNATLTGTLTQGVSDKRFKKNIELIPNALQKINSINGYTFEYDLDNEDLTYIPKVGRDIGVIAQEIEQVIPEAVSIAPIDRNEEGESKSGKNYLTVNYEKIIPLLIQSIKELKAELDELKAK